MGLRNSLQMTGLEGALEASERFAEAGQNLGRVRQANQREQDVNNFLQQRLQGMPPEIQQLAQQDPVSREAILQHFIKNEMGATPQKLLSPEEISGAFGGGLPQERAKQLGGLKSEKAQNLGIQQEQARLAQEAKMRQEAYKVASKQPKGPKEVKPPQAKAASFALRLEESSDMLDALTPKPDDPPGKKRADLNTIQSTLSRLDPDSFFQPLAQTFSDPETQKFWTAATEYVTASLREESGAAISVGEFMKEFQKSVPQVGEDPSNFETKRKLRTTRFAGLINQAGENAYNQAKERTLKTFNDRGIVSSTPGARRQQAEMLVNKLDPAVKAQAMATLEKAKAAGRPVPEAMVLELIQMTKNKTSKAKGK